MKSYRINIFYSEEDQGYSVSRFSLFRFFVVCRAPRGTQQKICGLGN